MVVADESTELPIAVTHELIKFALTIFDTFQGKIMSKQDRPVKSPLTDLCSTCLVDNERKKRQLCAKRRNFISVGTIFTMI